MFTAAEKNILKYIYNTSLKFIDEVSYNNGAILASLPTHRYNYAYPRDSALIMRALLILKDYDQIKRTLQFFCNNQSELGEWAQRYTQKGNVASYRPSQLDSNGLILWYMWKYYEDTKDIKFLEKYWDNIVRGMEFIKEHYIQEEKVLFSANSIHEWPPIESGYEIWANCSCYVGINAAFKVAKLLNKKEYKKWGILATNLWEGICLHLIDKKNKRFRKLSNHIDINDADVACLAPYVLGILPAKDELIKNTANQIREGLWQKDLGGIGRYLKKYGLPGRNNGGYGPYSMYTAWLAQYYVDTNQLDKAKEVITWFMEYNKDGYIPEHVATKKEFLEWVEGAKRVGRYYESGRKEEAEKVMTTKEYTKKGLSYWVTPLTWTHAEFIILYRKLKEKRLL
jgi:GH15 family glucan-1,4-alpha-glucosidase